MKYFFIILLFFSVNILFAQNNLIQNIWIGEKSECNLSIDSNFILLETKSSYQGTDNYRTVYYQYSQLNDTLVLYRDDNDLKERIDLLKFVVKIINKNNLELVKVFSNFGDKNFSHFYDYFWSDSINKFNFKVQEKLFNNSIKKFDKILFSASKCYGICPDMRFEINKDKTINFIGGSRSQKKGFFTGNLTDSLYKELIFLLEISEIDKKNFIGNFNSDAPYYAIEVHYNDKVSFTHTSFLPLVYNKLKFFLLDLYLMLDLKETEKFDFEFFKKLQSNGFK